MTMTNWWNMLSSMPSTLYNVHGKEYKCRTGKYIALLIDIFPESYT